MYLAVCFYHVALAFRVNLRSVITWMSRKPLLKTGAISDSYVTAR